MRDLPTYSIAKYMASLLKPHVGSTSTSVRNSTEMIALLDTLTLSSDELLIFSDIVSLYTKISLGPKIDY